MIEYIQFPTADGGSVLVEVQASEEQTEGLVKAGLGEKVRDKVIEAREGLEASVMKTVQRNAEAFIEMMHTFSDPPAEAEISFGVNAAAEAGYSAIGKVSGESSYTVKLTWKRDREETKKA